MVVIGSLTGEIIPLASWHLLFADKQIVPLLVFPWVLKMTPEERQAVFKQVTDDLKNGGKIFGSTIYKELLLSEYHQAIEFSKTNATEGKVLLNCS